jgi:ankyrin repeat protein
LLEKCPDLVNKTKKDGSTALHVAAINDHREVAETLITKVSKYFLCPGLKQFYFIHVLKIN